MPGECVYLWCNVLGWWQKTFDPCIVLECKHSCMRDQAADSGPSSSSSPLFTWSCPSGRTADVVRTSHVHLCPLPEKPASVVCRPCFAQLPSWADIRSERGRAKYQQVHYRFWPGPFPCPVNFSLLSSFFMGTGVGQFNRHGCRPPPIAPLTACRYL